MNASSLSLLNRDVADLRRCFWFVAGNQCVIFVIVKQGLRRFTEITGFELIGETFVKRFTEIFFEQGLR
jgi:hypothetical protein